MAELNNSEMFELAWDARFEQMLLDQLEEENEELVRSDFIKCSYCKSQHNVLYLNKHSHNQCSQCGAPLNLK